MKRSFILFGILLAGSSFFTSCNKKLKDDIKDLRSELNEVKDILGSNEPIKVTTTFKDDNDSTRMVDAVYRFKAGNNSTQRMEKNDEGNYDIYIERFSDVEWYEGAWIEFTYNPTTKEITNKRAGQYWDDEDPYDNYAGYVEGYGAAGDMTLNINVTSIDIKTGDITLTVDGSAKAGYTSAAPYYYRPNPGKEMHSTFSFAGKLRIFTHD